MKPFFRRNEPICEADVDGEEEFYYTEIEVPLINNNNNKVRPLPRLTLPPNLIPLQCVTSPTSMTSSPSPPTSKDVSYLLSRQSESGPTVTIEGSQLLLPNLADHMDMARPPHENPEYLVQTGFSNSSSSSNSNNVSISSSNNNSIIRAHTIVSEPFHQQATFSSTVQTVQPAVPIAIPVTNFSFLTSTNPSVS